MWDEERIGPGTPADCESICFRTEPGIIPGTIRKNPLASCYEGIRVSSKRDTREMGIARKGQRSCGVTCPNFPSETERERCREAPARALIGFYERRVAKERSFREINTRRSE